MTIKSKWKVLLNFRVKCIKDKYVVGMETKFHGKQIFPNEDNHNILILSHDKLSSYAPIYLYSPKSIESYFLASSQVVLALRKEEIEEHD